MRFKESLALDRLIDERRASLLLKHDPLEIDKRAQALAVLIDARKRLDFIANENEAPDVRTHVKFTGTAEDGRRIKPRKRRDLRRYNLQAIPTSTNVGDIAISLGDTPGTACSGRDIARKIRHELRRGINTI